MNSSIRGRQRRLAGSGLALFLAFCCVVAMAAIVSWGCGQSGPSTANSNLTTKTNGRPKPPESNGVRPPETPAEEQDPTEEPPDKRPGPKRFKDRRPGDGPKEAVPVPADATRVLHEPIVAMTEAHASLCLVKVGDVFPDFKLPEIGGSEEELAQHKGEKLTVVVFWNSQRAYAAEQFSRLQTDVAAAYGKFGVSVVAINVGDSQPTAARLARQYEVEFPCLLDSDGSAFALVGKEKLPRTYLLDPAGKILWFDIEYSQATQYELNNAVFFFLKKSEE